MQFGNPLSTLASAPVQSVYGPTAKALPTGTFQVTVPNNTKTLILLIEGGTVTNVEVAGGTTSFIYYNQPPYLEYIPGISYYTCVIPVMGGIDQSFGINITGTGTPTIQVYADTNNAYDESLFYNGPVVGTNSSASSSTTYTALTGPARVFYIECRTTGASTAQVIWNGLELFLGSGTGAEWNAPTAEGLILPAGKSITVAQTGTSATTTNVLSAYP